MKPALLALFVVASVLPHAAKAVEETDLVPLKHLKVVDPDGALVGDYLVALQKDPTADVGMIRTAEGERARLSDRLDTENGVSIQRFEDLSSGWWAEWRFDFGYRNMGEAEDFDSPWDWFQANQERIKRLNPRATYTLATSDGPAVEWVEQRGEEEQAHQARVDALAHFAVDLAQSPPPESARKLLSLAASFATSLEGQDSCGPLIEALTSALQAAGKASAGKRELLVRAEALSRTEPLFEQLQELDPVGLARPTQGPE